MSKRSAEAGHHMMLPLEKWIAEERSRSGAMRPLGEVAAKVVERAGQRREVGGSASGPTDRAGGADATRSETKKKTGAEAPASLAGAVNHSGQTIIDLLPAGLLDSTKRIAAETGMIVMCLVISSEPNHYAGSDTWIEF